MKEFNTELSNYYGNVKINIDDKNNCFLCIDNYDREEKLSISKKLAYMMIRELCESKIKVMDLFNVGVK